MQHHRSYCECTGRTHEASLFTPNGVLTMPGQERPSEIEARRADEHDANSREHMMNFYGEVFSGWDEAHRQRAGREFQGAWNESMNHALPNRLNSWRHGTEERVHDALEAARRLLPPMSIE
jgi:hypothetical protein